MKSIFYEDTQNLAAIEASLRKLQIKTIIFDFDGTLIDTDSLFFQGIDEMLQELVQDMSSTLNLHQTYTNIAKELTHQHGIHPSLQIMSIYALANQLELSPYAKTVQKAINRIYQIYQESPMVYPGALETVTLLNKTFADLYLMTHADQAWTWEKRKATGFIDTFKGVICMDISKPKSEQWVNELNKINCNPATTLIIGDNLHADIEPTNKLGARCVWIEGKNKYVLTPEVSITTFDDLPQDRIVKIHEIKDLIPTLNALGNTISII